MPVFLYNRSLSLQVDTAAKLAEAVDDLKKVSDETRPDDAAAGLRRQIRVLHDKVPERRPPLCCIDGLISLVRFFIAAPVLNMLMADTTSMSPSWSTKASAQRLSRTSTSSKPLEMSMLPLDDVMMCMVYFSVFL